MLRTATPPMVRNVGRDRLLRLLNSTSGAIDSRRCKACAFCLAEKLRRSGSVASGREANRLDWLGSERSARAVQSGPDSSGCLRNFSCASTGKDDKAYSREEPRPCRLLVSRERNPPSCTFQRIVRSDHPVTLLTASLLTHNSALTVCPFLSLLFPSSYHGSHRIGGAGSCPHSGQEPLVQERSTRRNSGRVVLPFARMSVVLIQYNFIKLYWTSVKGKYGIR